MKYVESAIPRFVVAGVINTVVTWLAYLGLLRVLPYRGAFSLAFALGILAGYELNSRFVFQQPPSRYSRLRFPLVYVAQYAVGITIVSACVEYLSMSPGIAPLAALLVTTPLTYLVCRKLFGGDPPR